jgi:hypothetical protein
MLKSRLFHSVAAYAVAFMSDACEVVMISTPGGDVRVNKSDYEAQLKENGGDGKMKLASKADQDAAQPLAPAGVLSTPPEGVIIPPTPSAPGFAAPPAGEPAADGTVPPVQATSSNDIAVPPAVPQGSYAVVKGGTNAKPKFFVSDNLGNPIKGVEGINEKGYDTDVEAWTAASAAQPH